MSRERSLCGKEEIIRVAVDIVDQEGIGAVSARRIAKELNVSSMTIYNYVKNLNDIKKRVLIVGFDRMYGCIYRALSTLPAPVGKRDFCRTMALEIFRFAQDNRSLFGFMFYEGRRLFHEDAEVRPFYTFLGKFIRRARGAQSGWQRGDPAYTLFESIINGSRESFSGFSLNLQRRRTRPRIGFAVLFQMIRWSMRLPMSRISSS